MATLKISTAYTRMFLMVDSADHITGKTGLTVTVTLSKAGGAFGALGGSVTEVSSGWYKIALNTTDTNTLGDLAYHCTATGADPSDFVDQVATRVNDDFAYPATSGRSMVVDAAGLVDANTVKVGPTGSGTAQTAGDIIGDTNDIQTRLPAALVSGRMDSSVGAMAANVITAAATAADFGAEIATAIWTDTTAGDFTTALSIGKSIMNGVSLGTGLTVARCTLTDTLTTYTGNTVQTGDSYARIGAAGVGLTAVALADTTSDAVIADAVWNAATATYGSAGSYGLLIETDLDATISSRGTSTLTQTQVSGGAYALNSSSFAFNAALDFTTTQKAATLARVTLTDTVTTLTNLPAITAGWLTATGIAADAITAAKVAADVGVEIGGATWDIVLASHLTSGTTGAALNAAGSAGDPWSTALPGAYGAGTAGKIVGDNLNATISGIPAAVWANATRTLTSLSGLTADANVVSVAGDSDAADGLSAAGSDYDTAGHFDAALTAVITTELSEGAEGQLAAAFQTFFNVASPTGTVNLVPADVTKVDGAALATHTAGHFPAEVLKWRGSTPETLSVQGDVKVDLQSVLGNTTSPIGLNTAGLDYSTHSYFSANVTAMAADTITATALASSATAEIASAWGASVVGNSRTRDMYLQGMTNKVAFDVPGAGQYTVYASDDTTALKTGTYTTAATDPVVSLDPA